MLRVPHAAPGADVSLEAGNTTVVLVVALIAVVALVMAAVFRKEVLAANEGTENMQTIGRAVQEGASAYLTRMFRTLAVFAVIAFVVLFVLPGDAGVRIGRSLFFLVGAGFSAAVGYLGMWLAVRANVRVASAAQAGDRDAAMRIAFRTGGFVGMTTVGLGLLGAAVVVLIYEGDAPRVL
jgi:K(+)-stimulated pyrophosphate-energized sodium pump